MSAAANGAAGDDPSPLAARGTRARRSRTASSTSGRRGCFDEAWKCARQARERRIRALVMVSSSGFANDDVSRSERCSPRPATAPSHPHAPWTMASSLANAPSPSAMGRAVPASRSTPRVGRSSPRGLAPAPRAPLASDRCPPPATPPRSSPAVRPPRLLRLPVRPTSAFACCAARRTSPASSPSAPRCSRRWPCPCRRRGRPCPSRPRRVPGVPLRTGHDQGPHLRHHPQHARETTRRQSAARRGGSRPRATARELQALQRTRTSVDALTTEQLCEMRRRITDETEIAVEQDAKEASAEYVKRRRARQWIQLVADGIVPGGVSWGLVSRSTRAVQISDGNRRARDHRERHAAGVRAGRAVSTSVSDVSTVPIVPREHGGCARGASKRRARRR